VSEHATIGRGSSAIEWTNATWNPVTGCTRVSPGCAHCYIERTIPFRSVGRKFERIGNEETTGITLHPERLEQPLRWRRPRMIFVNSLSDLFHEELDYHFVREVFNVMRRCDGGIVAATGKPNPRHVFQVLTKRPEQALELWRDRKLGFVEWPDHIWLGVSIENARYTWRAEVLREIPAAVRFISAEPLLGSLYQDSSGERAESLTQEEGPRSPTPEMGGPDGQELGMGARTRAPLDLTGIDWLIVGGESGGRFARPMYPEWARELRDACAPQCCGRWVQECCGNYLRTGECCGEGVQACCYEPVQGPAFFFKQWGCWSPGDAGIEHTHYVARDGGTYAYEFAPPGSIGMVYRGAGAKSGGRVLDGRTWDEMPTNRR
jgi:protein gp37